MAVGDIIDDQKIIKEEVLFTIETPGIKGETHEQKMGWLKKHQPLAHAALRLLGLG